MVMPALASYPHRPMPWRTATLAALLACLPPATAQDPPAPPAAQATPAAPASHVPELRYPRDRKLPVCTVGSRTLTLEDLFQHLEQRHQPGLREFLATDAGQLLLQSDLIAVWARQFADVTALAAEAQALERTAGAEEAQARALKTAFEAYLAHYTETLAQAGASTELSQNRVNRLLQDFQMKRGLGSEMQGWLDHLEPDDYTDKELRDYFNDNPQVFGGMVTVQHILVQHRDAGTGRLLDEEGQRRALARLADVRARLRPDGSNFAEVATLMSEDTRTARSGGELANVMRFDDRLPAILCRTAWQLKDGETSEVVESQYGYHIVHRLSFNWQRHVLFTEDAKPGIRIVVHRANQEDLLFRLRQKHDVRLHL